MPLILSDEILTKYEREVQVFLNDCLSRALDVDTMLRINQLLMFRSMLLWLTGSDVDIIRAGDVDAMLALIEAIDEALNRAEGAGRVH